MTKVVLMLIVLAAGLFPPAALGGQMLKELAWGNADRFEQRIDEDGAAFINEQHFTAAVAEGYADVLAILLRQPYVQNRPDLVELLHTAVQEGYADCVLILLNNGADVNGIFGNEPPLVAAVRAKRYDMVRLLVEHGAKPNYCEDDNLSLWEQLKKLFASDDEAFVPIAAFYAAIESGSPEIVRYLYQRIRAFNFPLKRKYQKTVLAAADEIKTVEMAATLHDLKIPLDGRLLKTSNTPIYYALKQNNLALVDYLLDVARVPLSAEGQTEIILPVWDGDVPLLKKLLQHQKKLTPEWFRKPYYGINAQFSAFNHPHDRDTALSLAFWKGGPEMVQLLLEFGADPRQRDEDGIEPIAEAVSKNNLEIVKLLLEHGADPNVYYKGAIRSYPLICLPVSEGHAAMAQLLIDAGARIDGKGFEADPLLHSAVYEKSTPEEIALLEQLIAAGLDVNALDVSIFDGEGAPPLYGAVISSSLTVVELLCQAGADPNAVVEGKSLLRIAWDENNSDIERILVRFGASDLTLSPIHWALLDNKPEQMKTLLLEKTPRREQLEEWLRHAIVFGRNEIVEMLLQEGADPNGLDESGFPVLYTALSKDSLGIAEALLRKGADPNVRYEFNSHYLLNFAAEEKKPEQVRLLIRYGAKLRQDDPYNSPLKALLRHLPQELPAALRGNGFEPASNPQQADELARELELKDSHFSRENFQRLFESYLDTRDSQMADLICAFFSQEELVNFLNREFIDSLIDGKKSFAHACLALVNDPTKFNLDKFYFTDDGISAESVKTLEMILDYKVSIDRDLIKDLLIWFSANGEKGLFLRFCDAYLNEIEDADWIEVLEYIVQDDDHQFFKKLYKRKQVTATDSLIMKASQAGNFSALEFLAAQGVDLGAYSSGRRDPFLEYTGNYEILTGGHLSDAVRPGLDGVQLVKTLLRLIPKPPDTDLAFRKAIRYSRFDLLREMHRAGLRVNLQARSELERLPGFKYLTMLQQGIDEPLWTHEMLIEVAKGWGENDKHYLGVMIARGMDVNAEDEQGRLALNESAARSRVATEFLIKNGARIDALDADGWTPLISAISFDQIDNVELLLAADPPYDLDHIELAAVFCAHQGNPKLLK